MEYTKADELKELAKDIIETEDNVKHIDLNYLEFVRLNKNIKHGNHINLAKCICLHPLFRFLTNKKYIIQVSKSFDELETGDTPETNYQYQVLFHEFLHIPKDMEGLVPHDFEEFRLIIQKYGTNIFDKMLAIELKAKLLEEAEKAEKKAKKIREEE